MKCEARVWGPRPEGEGGGGEWASPRRALEALRSHTTGLIGYEDVEHAAKLAVILNHHLLIIGPPGTAKSEFARRFFSLFNARVFSIQFSKFTTEEQVLGPVDIRALREEGVVRFNTQGMLPDAEFAFLDEIFDANDAVLRSLLSILNERQVIKAGRVYEARLITAIATSNYTRITQVTEAVVDRFLFNARPPTTEDFKVEDLARIVEQFSGDGAYPGPSTRVPAEAIRALPCLVGEVELPQRAAEAIAAVAKELNWSPRRAVWAARAARAEALLQGRGRVTADDVRNAVRYIVRDPEQFKAAEEKIREFTIAAEQLQVIDEVWDRVANIGSCQWLKTVSDVKECANKYKELLERLNFEPATEEVAKKLGDLRKYIEKRITEAKERVMELLGL